MAFGWLGQLAEVPLRAECPFCSAVSQTLRQEMDQTDLVVLAKIIPGSETESDAEFEILDLLSGENYAREGQRFRVNYFGKAKEGQRFLLMGVDPPDLLWSSALPLSPEAMTYVSTIGSLPKEPVERLKFYYAHLEHPDPIIARDAYDEFASSPYAEIIDLKPLMNREQLLGWIQKNDLTADRRRLYLVMLGVCGKLEDADLLEKMLRSEDPNRRSGMDALIACYATLKGEQALELVEELFLENKQSQYADTYAAIMALRFHGTEGNVISRERVQQSMRLLLDRPELADLVIPDLARWEDWSQLDKAVELFKNADEKTSWVRVPVINYLRSCPLPAAEEHLKTLKEIDPAAYKRAISFFPVPRATPSSTDSSSMMRTPSVDPLFSVAPLVAVNERAEATSGVQTQAAAPRGEAEVLASATISPAPWVPQAGMQLAARGDLGLDRAAAQGSLTATQENLTAVVVNQTLAVSVLGMAAATCWLTMWLSISGAGAQGLVARWLLQSDRH